jgi:hypothetical protein
LGDYAQVSRTVQEYLAELEQQNPVADQEGHAMPQQTVSTTDPDAAWAVKHGSATLGYFDNYLVDTSSRVILSIEATPARFRQEALAARRMLEHVGQFGIRPQNLAADKAYGSGEFLAWLLARDIQPHIPVIDRQHQTRGLFTREQFMNPEKTLTIARKKNHCTIEVRGAAARVISIARRKRNAKDVPRRSHAPEDPTGDCLFIGRSQRGKPYALWRERLNINAPNERATKLKRCSPSSRTR